MLDNAVMNVCVGEIDVCVYEKEWNQQMCIFQPVLWMCKSERMSQY